MAAKKTLKPPRLFSFISSADRPEPHASIESALDAAWENGEDTIEVYQYVGSYHLSSNWEKTA